MVELADQLAKATGFIKRQRKVSGANFIQSLLIGWLGKPNASLTELVSSGAMRGLEISPQGLDKRFTPQAADFCQRLLEEMFKQTVMASASVSLELLERFTQVRLIDATVNALPEVWKALWPGTGGSDAKSNQAALKVEVSLELKHGALHGSLMAGKENDSRGALAQSDLAKGSLHVADLGYFSLERMAQLSEKGVHWRSRLKPDTHVYDERGHKQDLLTILPQSEGTKTAFRVKLGEKLVPARLFAYRVPEHIAAQRRCKLRRTAQKKGRTPTHASLALAGWTLLITNTEKISIEEALVLYRSRWQIELIFKLWKQHMQIDHSVSQNPYRVLCELYIKLMAALVQHWIVLASPCWQLPNKSLVKACKVIAAHALCIAGAFDCLRQLRAVLKKLTGCLSKICRQNSRKKRRNTWKEIALGGTEWA